jgi:hypothetical protein
MLRYAQHDKSLIFFFISHISHISRLQGAEFASLCPA